METRFPPAQLGYFQNFIVADKPKKKAKKSNK